MNLKRILSLILASALILLSACGGDTDDSTSSDTASGSNTPLDTISLFYNANDSLDPYKAESRYNRALSSLIFDPLVKLDSEFQPQFILAEDITSNGKEYTVTLNNVSFTDGTAVTADDVVFSLEKALKSQYTVYQQQLSAIKSYKADGTNKVIITLSKADPYFANLLDFPIIKKDSDKLQDENRIELLPIGSGRYIFDTEEKVLNVNTAYFNGVPTVKQIQLVNAPDAEVTKYNLEVNNVDIYYTDLSDGVVPPMAGTVQSVNLNNLVYLGVNLSNKHLQSTQMRYALANAVDRTAICNDAYYSYAKPAVGLFNSAWSDVGNLQNLNITADLENVVANLEEIGYNKKDAEGFFTDSNNKTVQFKLIVSSENERRIKCAEAVKAQLEAVGIKIELSVLDWDKYIEALTYGNFDLYLAEVKLNNNMDVSELISSNGKLSYGIPDFNPSSHTSNSNTATKQVKEDEADGTDKTDGDDTDNDGEKVELPSSAVPLIDSAVDGISQGELSLVDIINAFNAEIPIIPLCHRSGLTILNPALNTTAMSSVSDIYFGITDKLHIQ